MLNKGPCCEASVSSAGERKPYLSLIFFSIQIPGTINYLYWAETLKKVKFPPDIVLFKIIVTIFAVVIYGKKRVLLSRIYLA